MSANLKTRIDALEQKQQDKIPLKPGLVQIVGINGKRTPEQQEEYDKAVSEKRMVITILTVDCSRNYT